MLRRTLFGGLVLLLAQAVPHNKLDRLIAEYNRYLNSATFVGNDVIYTRDVWDSLREAFTKIIREGVKP